MGANNELDEFGLAVPPPDGLTAEEFRRQIDNRIARFPKNSLPPLVFYPTHVEFDDHRVTEFNGPDDPEWLAFKTLYDKRDALLKEIAAAEDALRQKRREAETGPYYQNGGGVKSKSR